ncbi:hypothetical protein EYS09_02865 [Streptomyces kasugaensis]|uniref:Transmembrane protein n=1 Tax=Streptomyces kasugaensis TaxID=1946 RepID=A0A4Q9I138_STRKA|nr:hypothetical protein [Streptomyces kasugaensis]TBO61125.1 hypothetical protein EYS09_02865 [Streptomyces kasugaensis]
MPAQDSTPAAPSSPAASPDDPDAAASALRDAEAARSRAQLQAQLVPAWYGPSAAALLTAYSVGMGLAHAEGTAGLWTWAGLPVILLGLGLARLRKRSTGVLVGRTGARKRAVALAVVAAFLLVAGVCLLLGLGVPATVAVTGTALGLGVWVHAVQQNRTVERKLREYV